MCLLQWSRPSVPSLNSHSLFINPTVIAKLFSKSMRWLLSTYGNVRSSLMLAYERHSSCCRTIQLCTTRLSYNSSGAPNSLHSSITKNRHITTVKKLWCWSNCNEALGKILLTNQQLDKLAALHMNFLSQGMVNRPTLLSGRVVPGGYCSPVKLWNNHWHRGRRGGWRDDIIGRH